MTIIKNSCDLMLQQQFQSGNFPSSYGKHDDLLVHFCHGGTGAVMMLISAFFLFNESRYLEASIKAGELIWEKGILLKGNGVCHGITGNAYALFSLYKATQSQKWLGRAYQFCLATFDKKIQKICLKYNDP